MSGIESKIPGKRNRAFRYGPCGRQEETADRLDASIERPGLHLLWSRPEAPTRRQASASASGTREERDAEELIDLLFPPSAARAVAKAECLLLSCRPANRLGDLSDGTASGVLFHPAAGLSQIDRRQVGDGTMTADPTRTGQFL